MAWGQTPQNADVGYENVAVRKSTATQRLVCDTLEAQAITVSEVAVGRAVVSTLAVDTLDATSAVVDEMTVTTVNGITRLMEDVLEAEGDLVVGGAAGLPTRLAVGGANTHLTSDGTTAQWTVPAPTLSPGLGVQYSSVDRVGTNMAFGPVTNNSTEGNYTVAVLVNDPVYITPVASPLPGWFEVLQAGSYVLQFSTVVSALNLETNLTLNLLTNTGGASPLVGGTTQQLFGLITGQFGFQTLGGRIIVTFAAHDTFLFRISGATTGAEFYLGTATLTASPLFVAT